MTLNLPLLYVWLEEYCQISPNKNKSPNLWHVTSILVCCIFGSARVLHALKIGRTKNLTILLLVPAFCFTHKSAHFGHHFISGVNCFTTVDCKLCCAYSPRQKYSKLRCLLRVKGLVICFYLGWSGSTLLITYLQQ